MQSITPGGAFLAQGSVRVACSAMRTRFEIVFEDPRFSPERLQRVGAAALERVTEIEAWLSPYRQDSLLRLVNRHAAERPVQVEPRLFSFLQLARTFTRRTDGAFDLTVGPLLALWGLGMGGSEPSVPASDEVAATCLLVGMERVVELRETDRSVFFRRAGVRLDPGALGKGYALAEAAELLGELGIARALLHGGTSTVIALGEDWKVALQDPLSPDSLLGTVNLADSALSVSAVHGKSFSAEGRRFGHILDPRTGCPVQGSLLAAVVAPDAITTEALSTALLTLGRSGLELLSQRFPEAGFLLLEDESTENTSLEIRRPRLSGAGRLEHWQPAPPLAGLSTD